jgi:hypothetical protein
MGLSLSAARRPLGRRWIESLDPERFYLPAYIGPRGWFGLRLGRDRVDWGEVKNIVELSYRLVAPKTLVRAMGGADTKPVKSAARARRG